MPSFVKWLCELEMTMRLESDRLGSNFDSTTGSTSWAYRVMVLTLCRGLSNLEDFFWGLNEAMYVKTFFARCLAHSRPSIDDS